MPVVHLPMRSVDDIYKCSSGFIKYWETLCNEDGSGEYRRRFEHLVFYWRAVNANLKEPIEPLATLKDGFWPSSRVERAKGDELNDDGKVHEEFAEDDAFVGQLRDRPLPTFHVVRDVYEGYFVVV